MIEAALSTLAASLGAWYLYTALALGWEGFTLVSRSTASLKARGTRARRRRSKTSRATTPEALLVAIGALSGGCVAWMVFGAPLPALVGGVIGAIVPAHIVAESARARREAAMEAWPRLIDELRVLTSSAGMSIPSALFDVGSRAPREMRDAFSTAHREWRLDGDFDRSLRVLTSHLDDATADAACETLLVAHQVGGTDLERRLSDLASDRRGELAIRRDARARQAGARLARWFVLLVPAAMASVGMAIGPGRTAYSRPESQIVVVFALTSVAACWIWSGRLLRIPATRRVFGGYEGDQTRPSDRSHEGASRPGHGQTGVRP